MNSDIQLKIRIIAAIFGLVGFLLGLPPVFAGERELTILEEPLDPDEADRVRIWFPVEHNQNCRVTVEIVDDSGVVIRRLFDELLRRGYYNLYWDKRDDSGRVAPAGEYLYRIDDCGSTRTGKVEARYSFWELHSSVSKSDSLPENELILVTDTDSAVVSFEIRTRRGSVLDRPIEDSLFSQGRHAISWTPPKRGYGGWFEYRLTVGDCVKGGRIHPTYPPDTTANK
ncbi:MAG TPA: FlgD immunoglobulin-like domain containing protein [candidate division Zixibacteria bacterium]|nr:FlgD immunoglobulin-like domain containing protein [candidate division Zixibacteria bacterium]